MGVKAKIVAITTTSGTASEVRPFAVVTDDATEQKYPLANYAIMPNMAKNPIARERVHNAATIAGIAFANAFLGVCHSSEFHLPHGLANVLLIENVIRYKVNDNQLNKRHSANMIVLKLVVAMVKLPII